MKIAILDLGTNTFNLIIAEILNNKYFRIIENKKIHVKLGKGGINKKEINREAFQRGIQAIKQLFITITENNISKSYAFATAAIRSAVNGKEFMKAIESEFNIKVNLISGDKEAELIYYGVRQTVDLTDEKILILDIGGGSNEFIVADKNKIYWKKSYNLGIALLVDKFNPADPVTNKEIEKIAGYIKKETRGLPEILKKYNISTLIGASGSFETFIAMIKEITNFESEISQLPKSMILNISDFMFLYKKLIASTEIGRSKMKGLETERIDMIVLGSLFVKTIIDILNIKTLFVSSYSLKEGALYEIIRNQFS